MTLPKRRIQIISDTRIVLLRGINLGGARRVSMADLRAMLEDLGYETVRTVRNLFLLFVFPVPVVLIAVGYGMESPLLPLAAFLIQYLGLVAERWYFFAEAKHPQNLYYQSVA